MISNNLFYNSTEMKGYTGLISMTNSDITIQNCQFITTLSNYIPPSVKYYGLTRCLNSTFYGSVSFNGTNIDISNSLFSVHTTFTGETINIDNSFFTGNLYLYQTGNGDVLLKNNTINAYFRFNFCDTCKANVLNNIISKVTNSLGSIRINSCSTSVPDGNFNFIGNIVSNNSSNGLSIIITSSVSANIINNTIIRYNLASMNSGSFLGFLVESSNINVNLVNNLFADTGNNTENAMISFLAYSNSTDKPNIVNNLFVGTTTINNALLLNNSGTFSVDALNTYLGTTSNTYDYYYTNIFTDINDPASAYVLKSTATSAIDKGINFLLNGSSISDILVTDISLIHPRLYGTAIDIGAYEYQ